MILLNVLLLIAMLQSPDGTPTSVRVYLFTDTATSGEPSDDEKERLAAVADMRAALQRKKGITLVASRDDSNVQMEVLGREQREEPAGSFGGKSVTRMGDTIIRLRVRSGDAESDIKGMGQGTFGRAANDAAERFVKWIARLEPAAQAEKPLEIYFIDVEGGQATLFVTPSGESMLIDGGYPGYADRDVNRVLSTIKQAGLTKLDVLLVTHHHDDHVGNVPAIAARIPVVTFVDHGETVETSPEAKALYDNYLKARASGRHLLARPGVKIPLRDLDMTVVSANGDRLAQPLAGAGAATPECASFTPKANDPTENARSVGALIAFGRFRMIDLEDLTWNKEQELVCPNNLLGNVDVYLTTHHGLDQSNPPVILHALKPRVAIMNNGPKKGGSVEAMKAIRALPGLEDFWQLHYSVDAGKDVNMPDRMIANLDESAAHHIKLTAQRDGSFTITNARTKETKAYRSIR